MRVTLSQGCRTALRNAMTFTGCAFSSPTSLAVTNADPSCAHTYTDANTDFAPEDPEVKGIISTPRSPLISKSHNSRVVCRHNHTRDTLSTAVCTAMPKSLRHKPRLRIVSRAGKHYRCVGPSSERTQQCSQRQPRVLKSTRRK